MRKTFKTALKASFLITLLAALSSCMLIFPAHYDTHTVTINMSSSRGRFAGKEEAIPYTHFYEVRLYQYQNGEIMKKPCLTTVLTEDDLSFTCDTGYYYLEMDAWAEKTGTVVTGHGSTRNTESFDDGINVVAGVFELSYEQRTATVTVEMHAAPESEYPVWTINWDLNDGEWVEDFEPEYSFDWRRMYPLTAFDDTMNVFPTSSYISRLSGQSPDALVGWYLTPDFSDAPITRYQQLPLKDVSLYARWAPASGISSGVDFDEIIAFSLKNQTESAVMTKKTIKAIPTTTWPDNVTFTWLVDGVQKTGTTDTFTFEFTPGIHTVTCVVNGKSSESITITCVEPDGISTAMDFYEAAAIGGTIKLAADIEVTEPIRVKKNCTIIGNNHTISYATGYEIGADDCLMYVEEGALLTISDVTLDGKNISGNQNLLFVKGSNLSAKSVIFQNKTKYHANGYAFAAGLYCDDNTGSVVLDSCSFKNLTIDGTSSYGAGIVTFGGTIIIKDCGFSDNKATSVAKQNGIDIWIEKNTSVTITGTTATGVNNSTISFFNNQSTTNNIDIEE